MIRLDDHIWLFNDYYGSCSHCDNFIDRELDWLEDMLRKAYCFEAENDAIQYMAESNDFSWIDISETEVTEMIRNPELNALEGDN